LFVDRVEIEVEAGAGGHGCVSFRREKYVPKGGPDGGDGGRGGSVVFSVDENVRTLLDFRHRPYYRAGSGERGQGSNKTGRDGEDLNVLVPAGTEVYDAESGERLADLVTHGQRWVAARGGRGGRGNAQFATSTRQAPRFAEEGKEGGRLRLRLELKLIADVGLVGLPNAGKSTLLAASTRARPKVGPYPFTTLSPNLGIAALDEERTLVLADLPGLIEGAHTGKGLGLEFLRHVERTRVLVFVVSLESGEPERILRLLRHELEEYAAGLSRRPALVCLSKADLATPEDAAARRTALERAGEDVAVVSAATGAGVSEWLERCWRLWEATDGG
jgi:GTP-binding protein